MSTEIDWNTTALVIVDPLIDMLSPEGVLWDIVGEQVEAIDLIPKLKKLIAAAEAKSIPVMYSRVEVTEREYESMSCKSGLQSLMADRRMCVPGKGGRFHPELEPSESTILLSPRKGPSAVHSDFALQMQRRGLRSAVFAGMIANLCIESHVRDAVEAGFGAYVVSDAIGAISAESLEGTLANFGLHATGMLSAAETVQSLGQAACAAMA